MAAYFTKYDGIASHKKLISGRVGLSLNDDSHFAFVDPGDEQVITSRCLHELFAAASAYPYDVRSGRL
jgi:hypothetical protein